MARLSRSSSSVVSEAIARISSCHGLSSLPIFWAETSPPRSLWSTTWSTSSLQLLCSSLGFLLLVWNSPHVATCHFSTTRGTFLLSALLHDWLSVDLLESGSRCFRRRPRWPPRASCFARAGSEDVLPTSSLDLWPHHSSSPGLLLSSYWFSTTLLPLLHLVFLLLPTSSERRTSSLLFFPSLWPLPPSVSSSQDWSGCNAASLPRTFACRSGSLSSATASIFFHWNWLLVGFLVDPPIFRTGRSFSAYPSFHSEAQCPPSASRQLLSLSSLEADLSHPACRCMDRLCSLDSQVPWGCLWATFANVSEHLWARTPRWRSWWFAWDLSLLFLQRVVRNTTRLPLSSLGSIGSMLFKSPSEAFMLRSAATCSTILRFIVLAVGLLKPFQR